MRRRHTVVLGLVLAVVSVTPARAVVPDAGSGRRIEVVAAFYPLAEAARRVGGRHVHVIDVTPPGAEPHDLELTTDQVDHIQDADLVIVLGHGFQPAVEKAARDRNGPTLIARDHLRGAVTDDPHVWLDPARMRGIVDAVQGALTPIEPAHATAFARHAVAFDRELSDLDVDYGLGLGHCERTLLVTAHEAFGYLAARYGLEQRGIVGLSPDAEPNPKRLAELTDLVERKGVTTVFTEKLVSPKVADTLAREAGGLKTEVLDPLEGLTEQERARGADYVSVMRDNLRKLRTALACS